MLEGPDSRPPKNRQAGNSPARNIRTAVSPDERFHLLRLAVEQSAEGIAAVDLDGCITFANRAFAVLRGFDPAELPGKDISVFHAPDQMPAVEAANREVLRTGRFRGEIWHAKRDGSVFPAWMHNTLIHDEQGKPVGILGTLRDISELREAEAARDRSVVRYRAHFENVADVIFEIDDRRRLVDISPSVEKALGHKPEAFIGRRVGDMGVLDRDSAEQALADIARVLGGERIESRVYAFYRRDGGRRWFEVSGAPLARPGRPAGVIAVARDVTRKKRYEQALANAVKQWTATFDAISDWVAIIDADHRVVHTNKACLEMTGHPPEEASGRQCHSLLHGVDDPVPDCPVMRAVNSSLPEATECRHADGRWLKVEVYPVRGFRGEGLFVHVVRDVTDVKQKESEIVAARKAQAFSTLAGGIAHDYNNLLSIIWGNLSLLKDELTGQVAPREFVEEIEGVLEQARSLTHQFITLSRSAEPRIAPHAIDDLLEAVAAQGVRRDDVEVELAIAPGLPEVEIDPERIGLAFRNIVTNAIEAMPDGGRLEIVAQTDDLVYENGRTGACLCVAFTDTGRGIPEEDLGSVCDPYFTTKKMGVQKGMGLGLAIASAIVRKHAGSIQIESAPGRGTRVTVTLPGVDPEIAHGLPPPAIPTDQKPLVLLMEDEPAIRRLYEFMLRRLGCRAVTVADDREAILAFQRAAAGKARIDLALLDQHIIGGIGGVETLKKLREIGYDGRAVVVTGTPNSPAIIDYRRCGFDGKLLKPFTKDDLERVVGRFVPLSPSGSLRPD